MSIFEDLVYESLDGHTIQRVMFTSPPDGCGLILIMNSDDDDEEEVRVTLTPGVGDLRISVARQSTRKAGQTRPFP